MCPLPALQRHTSVWHQALPGHSCLLWSFSAEILPGLQRSWSIVPKTTDKWNPDIHRGRRDLAVRDIPAVWLVMCAKPGKLLASLAKPPLVSSWWMAVVLAATPPVVTTGTALSKVLLLVPTGVKTWPGGFPQTACGKEDIRRITTDWKLSVLTLKNKNREQNKKRTDDTFVLA